MLISQSNWNSRLCLFRTFQIHSIAIRWDLTWRKLPVLFLVDFQLKAMSGVSMWIFREPKVFLTKMVVPKVRENRIYINSGFKHGDVCNMCLKWLKTCQCNEEKLSLLETTTDKLRSQLTSYCWHTLVNLILTTTIIQIDSKTNWLLTLDVLSFCLAAVPK